MRKLLVFLFVSSFLFSCKKDNPTTPPPPVEVSREELLTNNTWQIQKITSAQSGTLYYYERGGQYNFNYDNDFLKFEKNGTGKYNAGNFEYDITWEFKNSDKTELTYIIYDYADGGPQTGINLTVKLENVFLSESSFKYAELYINNNGSKAVSSVYREPVAETGQ